MLSLGYWYRIGLIMFLLGGCNRLNLRDHAEELPLEPYLAELGRHLFFETRISANQTKSCSSCHDPRFAFTDTYRRSSGLYGDMVMHNAPSLLNTRFFPSLGWANPTQHRYEEQILVPLYRDNPPEMGLRSHTEATALENSKFPSFDTVLRRLKSDSLYIRLFKSAFPSSGDHFLSQQAIAAIVAYEQRLVSFQSPYDRFQEGDTTALSDEAKRGMSLFFSELFACGQCHPPPLFSDGKYYNIGLCDAAQDTQHLGMYQYTLNASDLGRYRSPSLRNVALTAPYFHDGSIATLSEALAVFESGGKPHPNKSSLVRPFPISAAQRYELLAFLNTLTDSTIFANPWYQDPF